MILGRKADVGAKVGDVTRVDTAPEGSQAQTQFQLREITEQAFCATRRYDVGRNRKKSESRDGERKC
jgi:hypothetical protein